jgi:hypothetical protein
MKKYIILAVLVVVALIVAVWGTNRMTPSETQACTTDAKMCPDGSAVGRTGPNCEFAECPAMTPTATSTTAVLAIGEKVIVNGVIITLRSLTEDSRCPVDVQCIQAGTVRVTVIADTSDVIFTLGEPRAVAGMTMTLVSLVPAQKNSKVTVAPGDYRFTFSIAPAPTPI